MRWFKHISMSHHDQILSELMDKFGAEGYGVWWIILEKIAQQLDEKSSTSLRLSLKVWASSARVSTKKFQNIVRFLEKNKTFSLNFEETYLTIECKNLIKYKDEYTEKRIKKSGVCPDNVPIKSGQDPDQETEAELETETETETEPVGTRAQPKPEGRSPSEQFTDRLNHFFSDIQIQQLLTSVQGRLMLKTWEQEGVTSTQIDAVLQSELDAGNPLKSPRYYENIILDFSRTKILRGVQEKKMSHDERVKHENAKALAEAIRRAKEREELEDEQERQG